MVLWTFILLKCEFCLLGIFMIMFALNNIKQSNILLCLESPNSDV